MHKIIEALRSTTSTNEKLGILKSDKNNLLLQRILKMTYDKVAFSYGIRKIPEVLPVATTLTLEQGLNFLEHTLASRELTGNTAINELTLLMANMTLEDAKLITLILGRDLKVGIGRTLINKVWKDLVVKPSYMRCGLLTDKTSSNIKYPAFIQLKCDGRYVAVTVDAGKVTFTSRSGEEQEFPTLEAVFKEYPDGVYMGELLVDGVVDRAIANGMINSSEPPHKSIYVVLWDVVGLLGFAQGCPIPYNLRFKLLHNIIGINNQVHLVECYTINSKSEALQQVSRWMTAGFEGGVLKDFSLPFKNHTSKLQLKIKLELDIDVRIIGFTEGTKGTSREITFGAITFETDDGMVQGQTSGFTEEVLVDFNNRREELIGKIMSVQFNDLVRARDRDWYALSHPRFIELRSDKTETDTIGRVIEMREMVINA